MVRIQGLSEQRRARTCDVVTFLNKIADQCSASMPIEKGGSRNLRPTPERRPRRTNTINTMKYDDNNSNSHTAFQPSNRSTINVK
ncbi:hypothetical protein EVAR_89141_1 [Eumeta japonica]|uniref:Uncharacterized protein n=1 Tax=Eumeta variegata TaxID=151549 RepID=A0A4C1ZRY6_EUMVA|nr:hypothetical protein EVAR_89141_1 [Eumeta japonica]